MNTAILSVAYFGPIQYYTKFLKYDKVLIEINDNYIKQTYRNRCSIMAANGLLNLSAPIKKGPKVKVKLKDVLISYDTDWQKLHYKAFESAYNKSPFFEFYIDDFMPVFEKKWKYLLDLNHFVHEKIIDALDIKPNWEITEHFYKNTDAEFTDLRENISPKKDWKQLDNDFIPISYTQVFSEKHGFMPNLSMFDLLCNQGPNALMVLEDSTLGYQPDYS